MSDCWQRITRLEYKKEMCCVYSASISYLSALKGNVLILLLSKEITIYYELTDLFTLLLESCTAPL